MTDADEAASSLPAAKEELIRVPKAEFISDVGAFLEGKKLLPPDSCINVFIMWMAYYREHHAGSLAWWACSMVPRWPWLHAGRTADAALQELEENYKKYRYIEQELRQSRVRLMTKVPEIAKALSAVELLIQKQEADEEVCSHYLLP